MISQLIRYSIVGAASNVFGYFTYLGITWLWFDPIVAVTIMYPAVAVISYFWHAKYTFMYEGGGNAFVRFLVSHFIGYGINISLLYAFSDYPHQVVQAAAVIVVAGVLFLLFKFFVYKRCNVVDLSISS